MNAASFTLPQDKAGIDQSTLDDADALKQNLACLPVWLAGSHELIMLVGPTYLQRIWCTLEVLCSEGSHSAHALPTLHLCTLLTVAAVHCVCG